MAVEGERGSISSPIRLCMIVGSGLTGAAILLSVDPIVLSLFNWFTRATEAFEQNGKSIAEKQPNHSTFRM